MARLQVGQALKSSSYLGLGSAVLAPMFLGTQPPYGTQVLKHETSQSNNIKVRLCKMPVPLKS